METIDVFKNFVRVPIKVFSKDIQEKLCDPIKRRAFLSTLSVEDQQEYKDNALRANLINGVLNVLAHRHIFEVTVPANLEELFETLWKRLGGYQHLPLKEKISYAKDVKALSLAVLRANEG